MGPCHRCTARPRVADEGNDLEMQRIAANVLNKQSRTADKGWSSTLSVEQGLQLLIVKKKKKTMLTKC
jgi:hypothetical protein